jgi:hypothetical protein
MKRIIFGVSLALMLVGLLAQRSASRDNPDVMLDVASRGPGSLGVSGGTDSIEPEVVEGIDRSDRWRNNRDRSVTVRLLRLEHAPFNWGDLFTYDVLIENTGRQTIEIPWSSDESLAKEAHAAVVREFREGNTALAGHSFRDGWVGLEVYRTEADQFLGTLEVLQLVGSQGYPGTIQTLAPKQKAVLRMYGRWATTDVNAAERIVAQAEVRVVPVVYFPDEGIVQKGSDSVTTTVVVYEPR